MATSLDAAANNSEGLRGAMSCDVCSEVYERTLRTPLVLPCGHTFCRICLVALKKTGRFLCPTCRAAHNNVQVEGLTVNFSLLNILPFCNEFKYEKCNTHGDDLRYWCCSCNLPLCSLCLYSGHPQGHTVKLAESFVQEKKLELLEKIKFFFGEIEDQKNKIKGSFNGLDAVVEKLFHENACLQDKLVDLNDLLDETQKASDITSIMHFEKAVKNFKSKEEAVPSDTDVENKEEAEDSEVSEIKDSEETEARSPEPPQEQQQSSGQATQDQDMREAQRATFDFREGRLLLHSLAKSDPKGLTFQMPSEVFMELSVDGRCLGRVFISLLCHMRRAQQFIALCMGTMGPSLVNTAASDKFGSTLGFKYVVDGTNKTRSQALLTNLEWGGQHARPEAEGIVASLDVRGGESYSTVSFGISTQNNTGVIRQGCFGQVVHGLEVVKAAFEHTPVTDVTITDSGLVLPRLSV